jgi:ABC-type ATPase involved in cell division
MAIIIQISELDARDAEGKRTFADLHFRLHRGEWACITGPAGAGKTLLLEFLCGQLRPDRGQILVDDRNVLRVQAEKLRQLRRRMGMILEGMASLERRTLEGYLTFKLRALDALPTEDARLKALDTLELVGLADQAERYPSELSAVEQQLFRLGLALGHDPVLLLLDDPVRALASTETERFLRVLEEVHLRRRLSILMTAAEASWAERYPVSLYALEGGQLRALHPAPIANRKDGDESSV